MKYCKNCGQNVQPTKKFSIGWFLIKAMFNNSVDNILVLKEA